MQLLQLLIRTILLFCLLVSATLADPNVPSLPKRFPWDKRMNKCFLSEDAVKIIAACREQNNWPSYPETARRVNSLFTEPDYDLIQRAEQEVGFSEAKFANEAPYFDAWYSGLSDFFYYQPKRGRDIVAEWKKIKGDIGYVKLAEAMIYYGEAWKARGRGLANTISKEAWQLYYSKLKQANETLDSASEKLKQTAPWYALKLEIAFLHPDLNANAAKLLDKATNQWPAYIRLYESAMQFSGPMWGGSFEEMDKIARYALEKNGKKGPEVYAIVYESLFRFPTQYTLADSKADWKIIKQGIRNLENSTLKLENWVWASFAKLACQVHDRTEAKRLYQLFDSKIGNNKDPENMTDACRAYAMDSE